MLRPWNFNMEIVRDSHTPIHVQIAEKIIDEIQRGHFLPGSALPGTRELSNKLGINRKTAVQAYDELISKGWLTTQKKRGTFVSSHALTANQTTKTSKTSSIQISAKKHRVSDALLSVSTAVEQANKKQAIEVIHFCDDLPDARLIPYQPFARAMRHALTLLTRNNNLHYADPRGSLILREAIQQMLNMERGLNADLDNICIVRGGQMGLFLAARLLIEAGDCIVTEQLSNPLARETFKHCNANLLPVNHNQNGIDLDALEKLCINHPVRAIYVTPHHQMPTGVVMPMGNRMALLMLAERYNFVIIEDDSGHEFNYDEKPLLPLASLDKNGRVIYIGSLSKVLAPGFRIGYLVSSEAVIQYCASDITMIDRQGNIPVEFAVAELLHTGEIKRHLTKSLKTYQERKIHICNLISLELAEFCTIMPSSSGLGLWLELASYIDTDLLLEDAKKQKLKLQDPNSFSEFRQVSGLRLGFAHLNCEEITLGIKRLKNALLYQSRLTLQA
jgi:GntR family transcriptional regulator / MocR family aminotransferase